MKKLITCLVVTLVSGAAFADIINVPGEDGLSIQDAIDVSNNGDTIMIEGGSYYEYNINPGGKSITLEGATDTGGLPVTTIDAQQQGRVIYCDSGETAKTVFKNLIITEGFWINGGGIYLASSNPTFTNCVISNNVALEDGGGMHVSNTESNVQIVNCTFTGNVSDDGYGGGIFCADGGNILCDNCTFEYNDGHYYGGAIRGEWGSSITLTDCTIKSNTAICGGGGIDLRGGSNSSCILTGVNFNGNIQSGCSGDSVGGGGLRIDVGDGQVTDCSFTNNVANKGGGIMCLGSGTIPLLTNCTFENNTAQDEGGGGIFISKNSSPVLSQCIITNNIAGTLGGGIFTWGVPTLLNCTVCGNIPTQIFGKWNNKDGNVIQAICDSMEGACCNNDKCFILTQEECEASDGDWQGYDALCDDVNCVQPPAFGACCINGEALALYDYDCDRILGIFMGEGTNPDDVTCPLVCAEDVNGDGVINVSDLLAIISVWGSCP